LLPDTQFSGSLAGSSALKPIDIVKCGHVHTHLHSGNGSLVQQAELARCTCQLPVQSVAVKVAHAHALLAEVQQLLVNRCRVSVGALNPSVPLAQARSKGGSGLALDVLVIALAVSLEVLDMS
jgi:hypothetical protein